MIKWIAFDKDDNKTWPSDGDEYFVSNGPNLVTAYWDSTYCQWEASCHVESTYDMAGVVLDIKVTHWAVIEDGMLPNKG